MLIAFAIAAASWSSCKTSPSNSAQTLPCGPIAIAAPAQSIAGVTVLGQVTGKDSPNQTDVRDQVTGTDLGTMWDDGQGHVMLAFGDTYSERSFVCTGPSCAWRGMTLALSSDHDPTDGLSIDMIQDTPGHALSLDPLRLQGATCPTPTTFAPSSECPAYATSSPSCEVTKIPTGGIAISGTNYVFFMSTLYWNPGAHDGKDGQIQDPPNLGLGTGDLLTNYSGVFKTLDDGRRWSGPLPLFGCGSDFGQVTFASDANYIYLLGAPAGKYGGMKVARVDRPHFETPSAYQFWDGNVWQSDETHAAYVVPPPNGEFSVQLNTALNRWIFASRLKHQEVIAWRSAPSLIGPWSGTTIIARSADIDPASCMEPGSSGATTNTLYGPMLHPWFNDQPNLYLNASEWIAYNVFFLRAPAPISTVTALGTNLLSDPGFEDAAQTVSDAGADAPVDVPWCTSGSVLLENNQAISHSGSNDARLSGGTTAILSQVIAVSPGASYHVHAFVETSGTSGVSIGARERMATTPFGWKGTCVGPATTSSLLSAQPVAPSVTTFAPIDFSFVAGKSSLVDLQFSLTDSNTAAWARVDDVTVDPVIVDAGAP